MVDHAGEVLSADGEDGVKIGEIVEHEIARFARWEAVTGGGIDDLHS